MSASAPSEYELELPPLGDRLTRGYHGTSGALRWLAAAGLLGTAAAAAFLAVFPVDRSIPGVGQIVPLAITDVRAPDALRSVRLLVQAGDTVAVNDVVAYADGRDGQRAMEEARARVNVLAVEIERGRAELDASVIRSTASLRQARARLDAAHADLRSRLVELLDRRDPAQVLSQHVPGTSVLLDRAVAAYEQALADHGAALGSTAQLRADSLAVDRLIIERERALTDVRVAQENIDRLVIRAPANGIVLSDSLLPTGEAAHREGELLFQIAQPGWAVVVSIAERDRHRVAVGQPVRMRVNATEAVLNGSVARIGASPMVSMSGAAPTRYRLWIEVEDPPSKLLHAGYSVQARIVLGTESALRSILRLLMPE
jgi:multidrug efflux pump subunit AcrA (membrane-fusion protein)